MSSTAVAPRNDEAHGFLRKLEVIGNKLPNPAILFLIMLGFLALLSVVLEMAGISGVDPMSKKTIMVRSLISKDGLHWLMTDMIKNYINFPPLGPIIVLTIGIGLVEKAGLLEVVIKSTIQNISPRWVTTVMVFLSFMSHLASDAAVIIVPPIAAIVFYSLGRHPFAGFAASLAAIMSGFTANILIVTTDVLLSGISTKAAQLVDPNAVVTPVDNWYFMSFSVIYLTIITVVITEKFVEPRLGKYEGQQSFSLDPCTEREIKALKATGWATLLFIGVLLFMIVPEGALLRNPKTGTILNSPLMRGIVPILFFFFLTVGLTFGIKSGKITNGNVAVKMMGESVKSLAGFMVMVFAIAQFIAAFGWSNIATIVATNGAQYLKDINMTGLPALLGFMLFGQCIALFVASGSAIWAMLSPVFVPMFMLLGYHPAFVQLAFRAGDTSLNSIMLVNPFLPLFIDMLQKYKSESGIGTYLSLMVPYAFTYMVTWYLLFSAWYFFELPIGPGIGQRLM